MTVSFTNALFISDIHLTEDRPDCIRAFFDFLHWIPESTDALFILGDFFEYWVGDDLASPLAKKVASALSTLTAEKSIKLFFVPGNRDFAIGDTYTSQCKMTLLGDETLVSIADYQVCVTHGDQYCTDDINYQRFRRIIRHRWVMTVLLKLPIRFRVKLAQKFRQQSLSRFQQRPRYIDVNMSTVDAAFNRLNCDVMVHGHTHMADIHLGFNQRSKPTSRMVLGDWYKVGWYGRINSEGVSLKQFSIANPTF